MTLEINEQQAAMLYTVLLANHSVNQKQGLIKNEFIRDYKETQKASPVELEQAIDELEFLTLNIQLMAPVMEELKKSLIENKSDVSKLLNLNPKTPWENS
jgi:hypothetical protein